ncbi:MAG: LysM peptidoglycan-binding domain-containing protein [Hyphomicrobiales bacterium]|nr:MAG: LysM peptidoglycan-binding domain-containing protein [Hyphomicrobiales bacterium]
MAVVAYAVVHGSDKILTQRQTASECLETVKLLEAQAEPDIHILDADSAEMSLGQIEELQKREVERKYIVATAVPASIQSPGKTGERLGNGGAISRAPLAAALLALVMLGLSIHALSHHGVEHVAPTQAAARKPAERNAGSAPPSGGRSAETAVGPEAPQPSKEAPVASETQAETYRIVAGDTLSGIARKIYHDPGRWRDIASANPGLNPNRLRPGAEIILPDLRRRATPR